MGFGIGRTWTQILAVPVTSFVMLGTVSKAPFLYVPIGIIVLSCIGLESLQRV